MSKALSKYVGRTVTFAWKFSDATVVMLDGTVVDYSIHDDGRGYFHIVGAGCGDCWIRPMHIKGEVIHVVTRKVIPMDFS